MKTVKAIRDTTLLRKHWRDVWVWRLDGSLVVINNHTRKATRFLNIEFNNRKEK